MAEESIRSHEQLNGLVTQAGEKLVLIHFFAGWCTSCTDIAPTVDALANEIADLTILKVNVEECPGIVDAYEITQLPTFVFVRNKHILQTLRGSEFDILKKTAIAMASKQLPQRKPAQVLGCQGQ